MFTHKKQKIVRPFVESIDSDEGHFYKTEAGKVYPSITTVLKLLDTKEWYPFWIAKIARDEGITEAQAEKRAEEIGAGSIIVGNRIHQMAEQWHNNVTIFDNTDEGKWFIDSNE